MRQFINSIIPTLELLIILMRWIFSNMTLKLKQYFEVRFQVLGLKQQNKSFNDICVTFSKKLILKVCRFPHLNIVVIIQNWETIKTR